MHLCFVTNGNMRIRTFLSMITIVVLQCCQLGGFPAQLGCFFRCVAGFYFLLGVAFFWASLIKLHAVFGLFFRKNFLSKSTHFVNYAEVVRFVFT